MNIDRLVSKIAFGGIQPHDYSDWTEFFLNQGFESENILILASFGLEKNIDRYEIETYFEKCLSELKIQLPDKDKALKIYAKHLCMQLLQGDVSVKNGIDDLSRLASLTEYQEPLFKIWDELSEDIYFIENEEYGAIWNSELTIDNQNTYVKEFAEQFLQLLELQLPINFWKLSYCESCKNIGESIIKTEKSWMPAWLLHSLCKKEPVRRCVCEKCLTPYPLTMTDFMGRKAYIEKLKKID